jgi:hypothetical protein
MCLRMEWASSGVAIIVSRTRRSVLQAMQSIVRYAASRSRDPHIFDYAAMSPGSAAHRLRAAPRPGHKTNQEKNMRAAEAMVSSAPNPMKIFPIREV